jgi:hypothetical protein
MIFRVGCGYRPEVIGEGKYGVCRGKVALYMGKEGVFCGIGMSVSCLGFVSELAWLVVLLV